MFYCYLELIQRLKQPRKRMSEWNKRHWSAYYLQFYRRGYVFVIFIKKEG